MVLALPATGELFRYPYHEAGIHPDIKSSLRLFRYRAVRQLTIHVKNILPGQVAFSLGPIEALEQQHPVISSPACAIDGHEIIFPISLRPRDQRTTGNDSHNLEPWEYLVVDGLHYPKYDGNNPEVDRGASQGPVPIVKQGTNTLVYRHQGANKALVTVLMEDAPRFHGNSFSWFDAVDFGALSGDLTLQRGHGGGSLRVTTTRLGNPQWIVLGVTLPGNVTIKQIAVRYQVSNPRSHIAGVRLTETTAAGVSIVRHDEETALTSTTTATYHSHVSDLQPSGSIAVALGLRFADTADEMEVRSIGVLVKDL